MSEEWLLLSDADCGAVTALNDAAGSGGVALAPRALVAGAPAGANASHALPAAVMDDPEYARWHASLGLLDRVAADASAMFGAEEAE